MKTCFVYNIGFQGPGTPTKTKGAIARKNPSSSCLLCSGNQHTYAFKSGPTGRGLTRTVTRSQEHVWYEFECLTSCVLWESEMVPGWIQADPDFNKAIIRARFGIKRDVYRRGPL